MALTEKQLKAVEMTISGTRPEDIGKVLGVSRRTIYRWLDLPDFKEAVNQIQERSTAKLIVQISDDISSRLQSIIPKAISTLESYIENPEARGSDRLRACHIVGSWAGLNQPQKQEPQNSPEESLKSYLTYLATSNGKDHQ